MISYLSTSKFFLLRRLFSGLLCVFLLVIQSAEATHKHDDDDATHLECEICLKPTGAEDEAVLTTDFCELVNVGKETFFSVEEVCDYETSIPAQSRAPPKR